ncbi:unnamed protein product [Rotaria sordida]|uniref:Uncharacterized protein n=1 Tax=Rotaria sordida TaxID=392033 RepID=A0A815UF49_9BILA|nr:unnamed protein product [Rotaria sordida]CAF1518639.1 unnamed protein product [Rotaria sordida]
MKSFLGRIPIDAATVTPSVPSHKATAVGSPEDFENSWRSKFLKIPVLILGIVQAVLTLLIIILEIASLAVFNYQPTGAGIWCSISFVIAAILTIMLGKYI